MKKLLAALALAVVAATSATANPMKDGPVVDASLSWLSGEHRLNFHFWCGSGRLCREYPNQSASFKVDGATVATIPMKHRNDHHAVTGGLFLLAPLDEWSKGDKRQNHRLSEGTHTISVTYNPERLTRTMKLRVECGRNPQAKNGRECIIVEPKNAL